jgi:hypothetical protein
MPNTEKTAAILDTIFLVKYQKILMTEQKISRNYWKFQQSNSVNSKYKVQSTSEFTQE